MKTIGTATAEVCEALGQCYETMQRTAAAPPQSPNGQLCTQAREDACRLRAGLNALVGADNGVAINAHIHSLASMKSRTKTVGA